MSTIPRLFLDRVDRSPEGVAHHYLAEGGWRPWTWRECEAGVAKLAAALAGLGVGRGDRVAILGNPDPHWLAADLAILSLGAITVGIYPTLTPEGVRWQLEHAGAKLLLAESPAALERVQAAVPSHVWSLADEDPDVDLPAFRRRCAEVQPDDLCTLVYTSGTTGNPKGAVVTHRAMAAVCRASQSALPLHPGDHSIVYLPLAHSLQRMAVYRSLLEDLEGWWCSDVNALPTLFPIARPHVLLAVPRVLEKMKARIEAGIAEAPVRRQRIARWAIGVGLRRSRHLEAGERVPLALSLEHLLADRLVLRVIRGRLGGNLRVIGCGSAPLHPEVARFFAALGIAVIEGWGLTETCAPATQNRPDDYRFGTVGKPLVGTDVRLAEDGEVLVKGPGLFSGYWEDAEATRAAFTDDGYFRTGDVGRFEDGFLRIVDRKKEILVTSGGKKVPPVNIEQRLESAGFEQAVLVGDGRAYLCVLLVTVEPDAAVQARVDAVNADLPAFERIKRWSRIAPLSTEDGTLTATMKVKRRVVTERYAAEIEAMYAG